MNRDAENVLFFQMEKGKSAGKAAKQLHDSKP